MKCPYCAEEIQDAAILCKYCRKRVKKNPIKILIFAVIIISISVFANTHKVEIRRAYYNAKTFLGELCRSFRAFAEVMGEIPESMRALAEYRKKVAEIKNITLEK